MTMAGAVLIRAVVPVEGIAVIRARRGGAPDRQLTNGPGKVGKVGQAFAITGEQDGMVATATSALRVGPAVKGLRRSLIEVTPRIGITRAADWPLRFLLRES